MIRIAIIFIASILFAAPALATTSFTAVLKDPVGSKIRLIANNALWICEGSTCQAELNRNKASVRVCKKVVKETGKFSAFGTSHDQLTAREIEKCNKAAH